MKLVRAASFVAVAAFAAAATACAPATSTPPVAPVVDTTVVASAELPAPVVESTTASDAPKRFRLLTPKDAPGREDGAHRGSFGYSK